MKVQSEILHKVRQLFSLDIRSLGIFRIGIALILLGDLVNRAGDITAFYTDSGVVPRALLSNFHPLYFSIHSLNGSVYFQWLLFLIAAWFGAMLLIGYKTRLATIVSWFLVMSLQNRNLLILQGGDDLLRILLFWSIFLPLGTSFSVDAFLAPRMHLKSKAYFSLATIAYYVQIIMVYVVTCAAKTGVEWHQQGSALYYSLTNQERATYFTPLLLSHQHILAFLTHASIAFELLGPLLFFIPFFIGPLRIFLVVSFMFFHLGMSVFLQLGIFPWIASCAFIPFLPGLFWENLSYILWKKRRNRTVDIYYDYDCSFCMASVQLIKKYFILTDIHIHPSNGNLHIEKEMRQVNSWILVDEMNTHYYKYQVILALLRTVPFLHFIFGFLEWKICVKWGEKLYDFVAQRRKSFCQINIHTSTEVQTLPLAIEIIVAFLIIYVLLWNIGTLQSGRNFIYRLYWIGFPLGLQQSWTMYAPSPPKYTNWFVIPGTLNNGNSVDILHGKSAVSLQKPSIVSFDYKNDHWLNYMNVLTEYPAYLPFYGSYVCRNWNTTHSAGESLHSLQIIYITTDTLPDYTYTLPKIALNYHYTCQ